MTHRRNPARDDQQAGDKSAEDELKVLDSSGEESVNGSMTDPFTQPGASPLNAATPTTAPPLVAADPITSLLTQGITKKAVSYLRVSTADQAEKGGQAEGFSIPAQRKANKQKALAMGAYMAEEFVERGVSGTSTNRPALQAMMKFLEHHAGEIDYVIVHKLDRLARSRRGDSQLNEKFEEYGVQLVSVTEAIDASPSGLLLHGIMSSIAEFYSRNLATETLKGMGSKVEQGGTIARAPIGYTNYRTVIQGREVRGVKIDEERAPIVKWLFEQYATGRYTVEQLRKEAHARGLTSPPGPKRPANLVSKSTVFSMLRNRYYIGKVSWKGAEFDGSHPAIIDEETFRRCQDNMDGNIRGERERVHHHYLKSTLYCGECGWRMGPQHNRNPQGVVYDYFTCWGRHGKHTDCKLPFAPMAWVEDEVARIYERFQISPDYRRTLEAALKVGLKTLQRDNSQECDQLGRNLEKIRRQQEKLLEAHFHEAVSLDLMKKKQQELHQAEASTQRRLEAIQADSDDNAEIVSLALELAENMATTYRTAPDPLKRQLNRTFFEKILVHVDELGEPYLEAKFEAPFDLLLAGPIRQQADVLRFNGHQFAKSKTPAPKGDGRLGDPEPAPASSKASAIPNLMVTPAGFEPALPP